MHAGAGFFQQETAGRAGLPVGLEGRQHGAVQAAIEPLSQQGLELDVLHSGLVLL
jgi:hypothetical protein